MTGRCQLGVPTSNGNAKARKGFPAFLSDNLVLRCYGTARKNKQMVPVKSDRIRSFFYPPFALVCSSF